MLKSRKHFPAELRPNPGPTVLECTLIAIKSWNPILMSDWMQQQSRFIISSAMTDWHKKTEVATNVEQIWNNDRFCDFLLNKYLPIKLNFFSQLFIVFSQLLLHLCGQFTDNFYTSKAILVFTINLSSALSTDLLTIHHHFVM